MPRKLDCSTATTPDRDLPQRHSVASADARPPIWSQDWGMTMTPVEVGNGWPGRPRVVVAVSHRAMRELIVELLNRDRDHWAVSAVDSVSELDDNSSSFPDLVIVDTAHFAGCCRQLPPTLALARIVVIGPEPDRAYRDAALHYGAGAWLSRECVAEELCDALRSAHACACDSHPVPAPTSCMPT